VPVHLLLAVVLVGPIFCTPQDDALSARFFFGLAEQHVFGLLAEMITRSNSSSDDSIQIVQAVVLVHALQVVFIHALEVNSDHEGMRLRVRVNRFAKIAVAMRRLGLFSAARTISSKSGDWEQLIVDETRIR
jgi:hypothetical protein